MPKKDICFEPSSRIFDLRSFGIAAEEPIYAVVIPPPIIEDAGLQVGDYLVWKKAGKDQLYFKLERGRP